MDLQFYIHKLRGGVALYHPPKPCYEKGVLMDFIERSFEELLSVDWSTERRSY